MKLKFTIHVFFEPTAVLRKLFDIRFSYKHCNFSRDCLLVKMASKTLIITRSIVHHEQDIHTFYLVISCTNFYFKVNFSFLLFFLKIPCYIRVSLTYSIFSFSLVSFMVYLVNRLPSTTGWRNSCLFSVTSPHPPTGVSRAKYIFPIRVSVNIFFFCSVFIPFCKFVEAKKLSVFSNLLSLWFEKIFNNYFFDLLLVANGIKFNAHLVTELSKLSCINFQS